MYMLNKSASCSQAALANETLQTIGLTRARIEPMTPHTTVIAFQPSLPTIIQTWSNFGKALRYLTNHTCQWRFNLCWEDGLLLTLLWGCCNLIVHSVELAYFNLGQEACRSIQLARILAVLYYWLTVSERSSSLCYKCVFDELGNYNSTICKSFCHWPVEVCVTNLIQ